MAEARLEQRKEMDNEESSSSAQSSDGSGKRKKLNYGKFMAISNMDKRLQTANFAKNSQILGKSADTTAAKQIKEDSNKWELKNSHLKNDNDLVF